MFTFRYKIITTLATIWISFFLFSREYSDTHYFSSVYNSELLEMMNINKESFEIEKIKKVKIGILDTGINAHHPNLNIVNLSNYSEQTNGHGTSVSAVIGANPSSVNSFSGLIPNMPLYTYNIDPSHLLSTELINGIEKLVQSGVKVINITLTSHIYNADLYKCINNSIKQGVTFVVSAGNTSKEEFLYPASFDIKGLLSVGSLDNQFNISNFSTVNERIKFYVPGENVRSVGPELNTIREFSGTSVAAPILTSLVAAIISKHPTYNPSDIEDYLNDMSYSYYALWKGSYRTIKIIR
ncbi:subtilisin [Paenibacillus phyllosphaerae]|uniref:Subtilisin n=1 Tax=Paenibacillus phyllosphaerae TaxID=274593 RepID=A0A7W5FRW5_9BACL|nr:S8 family serine peptidase [Paenibacillus phyllosphaerae]MBB3114732.1 subtilisin [Paenibacillus phyllosphaerae]